jgi:hypothetical protein
MTRRITEKTTAAEELLAHIPAEDLREVILVIHVINLTKNEVVLTVVNRVINLMINEVHSVANHVRDPMKTGVVPSIENHALNLMINEVAHQVMNHAIDLMINEAVPSTVNHVIDLMKSEALLVASHATDLTRKAVHSAVTENQGNLEINPKAVLNQKAEVVVQKVVAQRKDFKNHFFKKQNLSYLRF